MTDPFPCRWMVLGAFRLSSLIVWIPLLGGFTRLTPSFLLHICILYGLKFLYFSWLINPPPITFLMRYNHSSLSKGRFFQGTPDHWSALTTLWNKATASSIIFSSLLHLTVSLLLSSSTLFLSLVVSFSIFSCYTRVFKRLSTSGNTDEKLSDNGIGSIRYS